MDEYSSHTLAVCSCHTLSIVTTTCSVLTVCSIDASTTMQRHQNQTKENRDPAREATTQATVCVSTVIKVKSESKSIQTSRPATGASCYQGVRHIPCAVRCSDRHSKDVGCRQSRLYNNEITQMPVPVPNVQEQHVTICIHCDQPGQLQRYFSKHQIQRARPY